MKLSKFNILICLLLLSTTLVAQNNSTLDAWLTFDLKKELNNWNFEGEIEHRSIGFFEQSKRLSLQLSAEYKIVKGIQAGVSYTVMNFYDEKYSDFQLRNRYSFMLSGKTKLNRLSISLREKFELTTKDESDRIKDNGEIDTYRINPEVTWRNRFRIEYNIQGLPLSPGLSAESFYYLNDPDGNRFEKIRYTLYFEYKLSKHHTIELYSHYNREYLEDSDGYYVIGLGYAASF